MARYESETKEAILQRMLSAVRDDVDKRQGSVVYDLLSPAAIELALAYIQLDNVLTFGFASEDQPGEYLELRARELGVERRPATKATGQLTFTGGEGTVIPVGTRVSTDEAEPKYFVTIEDGTISGGSVTVAAEAEDPGSAGNVATGEISIVLGDLSGVVEVTNAAPFEGGADAESDESLLARYFARARKPATSGNVYHYEQWALEVPGVSDVKVIPIWNGPGTVKVVLLGDDKRAPDPTIVQNAYDYIESQRPIGATVTVVPAKEISIDVSAKLTLASGATIEEVTQMFNEGLDAYLAGLAYRDPLVRYTQIAGILLGIPPIIDFTDLTVNGGVANIEIDINAGDVAVRGTVTFVESTE